MRSLLRLFMSIIYLSSCTLTANLPRLDRKPAQGKSFYTIFPKNGTDTSKTSDFIKNVVGAEDLLPWTTLQDQLVSWTVEASIVEVTQLRGYIDVDRINEFHPPKPPHSSTNTTQTARDTTAVRGPAERENPNTVPGHNGYLVFARDGKNKNETDKTQKFLQKLVGAENVPPPFIWQNELRFWTIHDITDAQRDQAGKNPGIKTVEPNTVAKKTLKPPPRRSPPLSSPVPELSKVKVKRDIVYSTQVNAVSELVALSQPSTVPILGDLKNYVYEGKGGKNSFVYHVEEGVAFKAQAAEFPNVVPDGEHLQTLASKASGSYPWDDGDPTSHPTCTADKAVGKNYGTTKHAKLIVVKLHSMDISELLEGFYLIYEDLLANPARRTKSVVTMSLTVESNPESITGEGILKDIIQEIMVMGVPIVVPSGNDAGIEGLVDVDTMPSIWEGEDYPLIVVGSTDYQGRLSVFSQRGPHVFLHAVGEDSTCIFRDGTIHVKSGTSNASPMVAGEVANLLSYDTVPFDTSRELVKNLRDYLKTDAGSWSRSANPEIRVIWNGVTEKDNSKVPPPEPTRLPPPPPPSTQPPPIVVGPNQCSGLAGRKYVARSTIADLVVREFCPTAVLQGVQDTNAGSIMRRYNEGTVEDVSISITWAPGLPFNPNVEDCKKYLGTIVDGCDGNEPNNPENYKGGGSIKVGEVEYRVEPKAVRQLAAEGKTGGCRTSYKWYYNEAWMWGHGWASGDHGAALKEAVKGCALLPDTWDFQYGMGGDGREWTAKFRTGVFQNSCTGHAGTHAGAPAGFDCGGSI
ncbi:peptidase S8/S53 domain-containing protein [Amylocarpus encephaloides]|uniref:Peptidase S8/S53 domain-containing protein n=1 Tax=Amylocarpus encephaloides TaxID=45428 RepID=A0A9P8C898_9HELO|nr:peptidase S8/S53 domain-containing protein [Amylocarpus encephaloides]